MAKTKTKNSTSEMDGPYLLKIVLYMIIGTLWLKLSTSGGFRLPLPVGFIIGGFIARNERFQVDRKIEYAVLLIAMLIGYFASFGLYVQI